MTLCEYDALVADRGVELAFELADGETVALLRPNGSGKSTVLSVISGLLRPDRARVVLDGRMLTELGDSRREVFVAPHDRRVASLAQEPLLFPHLSVLDNVAFGPRSGGSTTSASREAARHWLAEVGIEDLADRNAGPGVRGPGATRGGGTGAGCGTKPAAARRADGCARRGGHPGPAADAAARADRPRPRSSSRTTSSTRCCSPTG